MRADEQVIIETIEVECRQQFLEIRIGADGGLSFGSGR